jgi:ATP-dependent RNA helicase RhlB
MVATSVAARGIHVPDITHVINFDMPYDIHEYIYR